MRSTDIPIIDAVVLLEKFSGKGGWTYAALPGVKTVKSNPFGWQKVRGFIENFEISKYHLMPMGNGNLFLPVRAEIRKKIKKQAGDTVHVVLFTDNEPDIIPEEFLSCIKDDPDAWHYFQSLSHEVQQQYSKWIYSAKNEDAKTQRMAQAINAFARGNSLPLKLK